MTLHCDIFCNVVDNYGDIGVCWRLARQLAHEHGVGVRLWVDDLASLHLLCPDVDPDLELQHRRGIEVRHWLPEALPPLPGELERLAAKAGEADLPSGPLPPRLSGPPQEEGDSTVGVRQAEVVPAQLVIEAFACELPERYVHTMAAREHKPVWINLDYLSAEEWVEGCHKLPSPHPRLPIVKYFFFPGFTGKTGGLLLERDLFARRDLFQADTYAQADFWKSLRVPAREMGELRISLFCYENPALPSLLDAWERGGRPVVCVIPEGRILPQVAAYFGARGAAAGDTWLRGNLRVHVLPFIEQERYDLLLWACDLNFVRGEDSFVRGQWAGRPFVWHIYPQHDGVHMRKLRAFMDRYCANLPSETADAVQALWEAWNMGINPAEAWNEFAGVQSMLRQHSGAWAQALAGNNLALNLLDFFREIGKMRDFGI